MTLNNNTAIATYWAKKMLLNLDAWGDEMEMVNRDHESELSDGDSLKIQKFGNVTINTGVTISHSGGTMTEQTIPVDQYHNYSIPLSKVDLKQSKYPLKKGWVTRVVPKMAEIRADRILGHYASAASANQLGSVTVTKNNIIDTIVDAYYALFNSKAIGPDGLSVVGDVYGNGKEGREYPYLMVNGAIAKLIEKSPQFNQATTEGEEVLRNGVLKKVKLIKGFKILKSTFFEASGGVHNMMFGTKEAITYISQIEEARIIEANKDDWNTYAQGLYAWTSFVENSEALGYGALTIA